MLEQKTDTELVQLFLHDETLKNKVFKQIVKKYEQGIYSHLRKMLLIHDDTNDVMQETFIKVWKNLSKFRNDASLFTWIYRIATNQAINYIKQKNRKHIFSKEGGMDYLSETFSEDVYFDGDEFHEKFQKALQTLPEKQKLVFNMKYFDNMKYEEIAEILELTVGGLKASYHHAVKKIEAFIKSELN